MLTTVTDSPHHSLFIPSCVVSGGQTGIDRAALDAAMAVGIDHGGWCPKDRLAEDGSVPSRYRLLELESRDYAVRTEQNVIDSDATLILYEGKLGGGTLLTYRLAKRLKKPYLLVALDNKWSHEAVRRWLSEHRPETLNVAGPRESSRPGIYERSFRMLLRLFEPSPGWTS